MTFNNTLLRALDQQSLSHAPIWIMRQAGRYLPAYRALRARHAFSTLVHTPELAAEVSRIPIDLFGFDAAILFSDILVIAEVFGFAIEFLEGRGISLRPPDKEICLPPETTLDYVARTIRLLKSTLTVPLIGFCGGPYTVCRYMKRIEPEWLDRVTTASITYLQLQVDAGADVVQIFDSWAGLLPEEEFHHQALPYLRRLVSALQPSGVPIILFCRGASRWIHELSQLGVTGIGFDWEMPMSQLRRHVPEHIVIQGNLDPTLLEGEREPLKKGVDQILEAMRDRPGYIFNLGHGITPSASVDHVRWLVDYVRSFPLTPHRSSP